MFKRVGLVGVGFMGGSFALACRSAFECEVFGVDINPQALKKAKELGVIDHGSVELKDLKDFEPEVVMLATPVRSFRSIAHNLKGLLPDGCIVSDMGSVKGRLVYELEEVLGPRFVGGHPIAGTEKSGVEHALSDLFKGKKFILTPTQSTDLEAKERIKSLWESLGSLVEEMDPYLHDIVFGAVSHLPHAVAFALIRAVESMSDKVDLFRYPGAGFRDFTRIAGSDPIMWRDIFLENSECVLSALEVYSKALEELKALIQEGKEQELTLYLERASRKRRELG
ncbi:MAG: prephenate dehydrogenase/arogenate dehydrogenase family protein [Aquificota bacterium]|nr:MAG: prephenate dehydrogenase/arogenate dehydrogenase family protein [Aquificota bacterium]